MNSKTLQAQIEALPRQNFCKLPTSVERFAAENHSNIWIKRDDLTAADYGGNKVRKLEFLLADAKARGHRELLAFGYAGSNFCAATAFYAYKLGMRSISMLLPQANARYVRENLLLSHVSGAELYHQPSELRLGIDAVTTSIRKRFAHGQVPYWIPAGGSSPLGILGFVKAGLELAQQIAEGELPAPKRVYVAMGSMGSTAGLAIAFAAADLDIEVVATRVVDEKFGNEKKLRKLIAQTLTFMRSKLPDFPHIELGDCRFDVRNDQFGREYGDYTEETQAAISIGKQGGLELDVTYSAKAFASLLADRAAGYSGPVLFWNTHSSADVSPLIKDVDFRELPEAVQHYFNTSAQDE